MLSRSIKKSLKIALNEAHKSSPILFALLSSILASIGLATNSQTTILGAMLFSPIGSLINKSNIHYILQKNNVYCCKKYGFWIKPLLFVIMITVGISYILGKLLSSMNNPFTGERLTEHWPTPEMKDRANPVNALYMILVAAACGFALPISIILNSSIRFVAVGIATALIPPLSNIGIALSLDANTEILQKFRKEAIITGIGIFVINMLFLWLPSRLLLQIFTQEENIFQRIETYFNR